MATARSGFDRAVMKLFGMLFVSCTPSVHRRIFVKHAGTQATKDSKQRRVEPPSDYLPLSLARASTSSKKTMEGATALAFRNTCRRRRRQQWTRGKQEGGVVSWQRAQAQTGSTAQSARSDLIVSTAKNTRRRYNGGV